LFLLFASTTLSYTTAYHKYIKKLSEKTFVLYTQKTAKGIEPMAV